MATKANLSIYTIFLPLSVESYNSVVTLKYMSKARAYRCADTKIKRPTFQHCYFSHLAMWIRSALGAMDVNCNVARRQATTAEGGLRWRIKVARENWMNNEPYKILQ